ncbi:GNAT superfamily N-acetyltransferase [Pedobacter sp. UYEF25]
MNLNIRKAELEDCEAILTLINELALYERAPQEVTVNLAHFRDAGFGTAKVWDAFIAEVDGNTVGFALYYTRYSTWKGCRLYLEDFIVTEKFRGKGIGKRLFEKVIEVAKNDHYNGMVWQVLDWNKPALDFYHKYNAEIEIGWLNASFSAEKISKF